MRDDDFRPLMELHLDCLGGLAGDMFVACVLDAFPEHRDLVLQRLAALAPVFAPAALPCRLLAWDDGIFAGSRFEVPAWSGTSDSAPRSRAAPHRHLHGTSDGGSHVADHGHEQEPPHGQEHGHEDDHDDDHAHANRHGHGGDDHPGASHSHRHSEAERPGDPPPSAAADGHVPWASIRERLQQLLPAGVLRHALGIFEQLAIAEAEVHGVAVDEVEFHEVGAWDSVADVVAAATLIDRLDARRWSVGALPLGGGRIRTAHGPMPVPPPATARLLRGFAMVDDGIAGERVTPTGAAILKHLLPEGQPPLRSASPGAAAVTAPSRVLRRSGVGFGSRRLAGISNCVRLLAFDDAASPQAAEGPAATSGHRELAVIEFEVDDQSAEELSMGLDRLRAHRSIFDVVQSPVFGKKGRIMTSVRLLASPAALAEVIDACFRETTTIGLRHSSVRGAALPRSFEEVSVDGRSVRVKLVERPGGATAKAEADDALAHETNQARRRIRQEAERLALARVEEGRSNG